MANYCYNRLLLTGDAGKVKAARQMFREIVENQETKNSFRFPDFITAENSFMWNIRRDGRNILFETDGIPNLEALQEIADHFGVGFVNRYEEPNSYIYGEASYDGGLLSDINLSPADFAACYFDEKQEKFIYGDKAFEWEADVIEALFEDKKHSILYRIARLSALYSAKGENLHFPDEGEVTTS